MLGSKVKPNRSKSGYGSQHCIVGIDHGHHDSFNRLTHVGSETTGRDGFVQGCGQCSDGMGG